MTPARQPEHAGTDAGTPAGDDARGTTAPGSAGPTDDATPGRLPDVAATGDGAGSTTEHDGTTATTYTVTLRPEPPGRDRLDRLPAYRLRLLLKLAWRRCGLRAVSVQQATDTEPP